MGNRADGAGSCGRGRGHGHCYSYDDGDNEDYGARATRRVRHDTGLLEEVRRHAGARQLRRCAIGNLPRPAAARDARSARGESAQCESRDPTLKRRARVLRTCPHREEFAESARIVIHHCARVAEGLQHTVGLLELEV